MLSKNSIILKFISLNMQLLTITFSFLLCGTIAAQEAAKELYPASIKILDLSTEKEKLFNENYKEFQLISDKMTKGVKYEALSKSEKEILSKVDETVADYWDIMGGGCSWYCGGGPDEVTASSMLGAQGNNSYKAENAHDLSYKSAWVEGVPGYGIGEFLLYKFTAESPRINEIIVVNGYVKSQGAWENNSRVKKLKIYVDDKPYAILNLEDSRSTQRFNVDPIGNSNRVDLEKLKGQPGWALKFEIVEVYKGLKYDDVAISEIYFDGLDVH
jgi:hypothetical protein